MDGSRVSPYETSLECEEMFRTLVEESLIGSFIIQDGRFVYVNRSLADILGYTRDELMALDSILSVVHPDDRERVGNDMSVLTGSFGRKVVTKCRVTRGDGGVIFAETLSWGTLTNGHPSITGSITDVSGRIMLEESVRESETTLRTILDSVYDAIIIHDPDGSIIGVNRKMLEMYHVGAREAMEYNIISDYSSPSNPVDKLPAIWKKVLKGGEKFFEWKARRPSDGSEFDVEIYLRKLRLWDKDVILASVRDITKRKEEEKERSALYHMMTHDIKGPLSIIYGYGDIISSLVKDREVLDMIKEVKKAAKRISDQVSDMLDISRLEYGETKLVMEPVNIAGLLNEVIEEHKLASDESGVIITLDTGGFNGDIHADPKQLMRAVGNLVSNAVVYCGRGCGVTVRTCIDEKKPGFVCIEVADNGAGIPIEDIPFIFDKYYRSARTYKKRGTGLGLAIVKTVAESHGGAVELDSEEGRGSTFRIHLPAG